MGHVIKAYNDWRDVWRPQVAVHLNCHFSSHPFITHKAAYNIKANTYAIKKVKMFFILSVYFYASRLNVLLAISTTVWPRPQMSLLTTYCHV